MRCIYLFFGFLFWVSFSVAQDCPPFSTTFNTQGQIDSFIINYPNCTSVTHLKIESDGGQITNLSGLGQLEYIYSLTIQNNDSLQNLSGLSNLSTIRRVTCIDNNTLADISDVMIFTPEDLSMVSLLGNENLNTCTDSDWFCALHFLGKLTLSGNGPDCDALEDIESYCYTTNVIYVKENGTGDGTSWGSAIGNIQTAIDSALSFGSVIWIAEGTYKPSNCTSCTEQEQATPFQVIGKSITFLGGFSNSGTPNLADRDWDNHPTIMSGDIGIENDTTDNSFTILQLDQSNFYSNISTILDGLIFQDGNANLDATPRHTDNGGAIVQYYGTARIKNSSFKNNHADERGGAFWTPNYDGNAYFSNCRFENNSSNLGGALSLSNNTEITNCSFYNNNAANGGAIRGTDEGDLSLIGSVFYQNEATVSGGALYIDELKEDINLSHCTFVENSAPEGSALFFQEIHIQTVSVNNTLFFNNIGQDIRTVVGYANEEWDRPISILNLEGVMTSKGTEDSFVDLRLSDYTNKLYYSIPDPFTNINNGAFSLSPLSPAINAGVEVTGINLLEFDLAGNNRFVECPDIGAYEFQEINSCNNNSNTIYVNSTATGNNDGSSWNDAFTSLQDALSQQSTCPIDSIFVATGTYNPTTCSNCDGSDERAFSFEFFVFPNCNNDSIVPAIYGGFPNIGNPSFNDRDWETNPTIFSGNIGDSNTPTDNTYAVFRTSSKIILDGVSIQDGYADGPELHQQGGAAISSNGGFELRNSKLNNNYAIQDGGAIYAEKHSIGVIENCELWNNSCGRNGGVIYMDRFSKITFSDVHAWNNLAQINGGVLYTNFSTSYFLYEFEHGSGTVNNCTFTNNYTIEEDGGVFNGNVFAIDSSEFSGNSVGDAGGAIYCISSNVKNTYFNNNNATESAGGAIYNRSFDHTPSTIDCTFENNTAIWGGAITFGGWLNGDFEENAYFDTNVLVDRCIFRSNTSTNLGGAITCHNADNAQISNSLFENNEAGQGGGAIRASHGWDGYFSGVTHVKNNTFINNNSPSASVFSGGEDTNPQVANNIMWGNSGGGSLIEGDDEETTILYNCLMDIPDCTTVGDYVDCQVTNLFTTISPFVDLDNGDYTLNDSTIAIDNGALVTYLTDLAGNPRTINCTSDMGAYEFFIGSPTNTDFHFTTQNAVDSFPINYPGLIDLPCNLFIGTLSDNSSSNITNLSALSQIQSIASDLQLMNNDSLIDFAGLGNLQSIGRDLIIKGNATLENISALSNLSTINNNFTLDSNPSLINLSGLENITNIGGNLELKNNQSLVNLSEFNNLLTLNGNLTIFNNDGLTSLSGLSNLIFNTSSFLSIRWNNQLSSCSEPFICYHVSLERPTTIQYNDPDCNNEQEILDNCTDQTSVYFPIYYDLNQNKIQDNDEPVLGQTSVLISPQNLTAFSDLPNGGKIFLPNGSYTFSYNQAATPFWLLTTDSSSYEVSISLNEPNDTISFGLYPSIDSSHFSPSIYSPATRCQEDVLFTVVAENRGTTVGDGILWFSVDDLINQISFVDPPDTTVNPSYFGWEIDSLYPGQLLSKNLYLEIPAGPIGDFLHFESWIDFTDGNGLQQSDYYVYTSQIVCAYDPNDKLVSPAYPENYSLLDEELNYTIRFQNTGNAEAYDVVIRDTLDVNLDPSTFAVITSSHQEVLTTTLSENRYLTFSFENIFLPDSTTNFDASQGFVSYRITPLTGTAEHTVINNTASIYFDFNDPITTNTTQNTLLTSFDADEDGFEIWLDCDDFNANLNPGSIEIPNNNIDENCDGILLVIDQDNDGFNSDEDCNDDNALVYPGNTETVYNGLDDDCDDATLDDDLDQDGFVLADDCDDENALINSEAEDIPNNGVDENCDGEDLLISTSTPSTASPKVYPNPITEFLIIELPKGIPVARLTLKTSTGKSIDVFQLKQKTMVDLTDLPAGVYFLVIESEGNLWVEKSCKF